MSAQAFGMWATFAVIVAAMALYARERVPLSLVSLGAICALMLIFQLAPMPDDTGDNRLGPAELLSGFANPALLALIGLMIMGRGLTVTGILQRTAAYLLMRSKGRVYVAGAIALLIALLLSGVINNTPIVVIFIPIMHEIAERTRRAPSKLMLPLSYAAILGGMTTLIGSSTNLLVSESLVTLGRPGFGFFDFSIPGFVLAGVGLLFLVFVGPALLPERRSALSRGAGHGRQFAAQITVEAGSRFDGMSSVGGAFPELRETSVRLIQRGEHAFDPPFDDDFRLAAGDVMVVFGTRDALTEAVGGAAELLHPEIARRSAPTEDQPKPEAWRGGRQALAELMVTPSSALIGRTLERIGFRYQHHCIVIGVQRRYSMIRRRITEIPLEAGDILLVQGRPEDITELRSAPGVLLIEWSATELPATHHAVPALVIFGAVVAAAASGMVPIVVAALCGAGLMVAARILSVERAVRAIDSDLVLMIAAALAMGAALQVTGGAKVLADLLLAAVGGAGPAVVLSVFFALIALLANAISSKATAVLFTPISVSIADSLGLPYEPFAVAVIFAANSAFATPIGYQTNLLVMAPGNYRFTDFMRLGLPLLAVVWLSFSLFAPVYYGL
ncbi:MAG: SLC13 family permease [Alphaproteobacteria bacterium]|nr:SLC13 family permease [Alphaproteobacteria bacterium]